MQPAISAVGSFLISSARPSSKVAAWILSKLLPPLVQLAGWILSKVIPAVAWLVTGLIRVGAPSPSSGSALIRGIGYAIKFASSIKTKIGKRVGLHQAAPGKVKSAVPVPGSGWWMRAGRSSMGLISGIKSSLGKLGSFLRGIGKFVQDQGPTRRGCSNADPAGIPDRRMAMRGIESRKRALGKQPRACRGWCPVLAGICRWLLLAASVVALAAVRWSSSASHEALVAAFVDALDQIDWRIRGQDIVAVSNNFNRVRGHR